MLNKKFIQEKIELIQQDLVFMEKLSHFSFQEIVSDFIKMNAFERLLEKVVVRAIDINEHFINELATAEIKSPQSYKETFFSLQALNILPEELVKRLLKAVDTRHALVHDYDELQLSAIYSSVRDCLKDYHEYCDCILRFIKAKIK